MEHIINLVNLCNHILQPLREEFGPIRITAVIVVQNSTKRLAVQGRQHCNGEAADFESSRTSNPDIAHWINDNLDFDQLILEFYDGKDPHSGWVHCSYRKDGTNRNKAMTALRVNGKTQYKDGLLS